MSSLKKNVKVSVLCFHIQTFENSKNRVGFLLKALRSLWTILVWAFMKFMVHMLLNVPSSHSQEEGDCTVLAELKHLGSSLSTPGRLWRWTESY